MGKVIFNADDFGYSRGVNYGIIDCHNEGILTSTTLMANMPGFDHAVLLAKKYPTLGIGIHLTLTAGAPVLKTHQTLVDSEGNFKKLPVYEADSIEVDFEEVYAEWDAQIKKAIDAGIQPTHLDSHHHTHTFGKNQEIVVKLARKYNLPVRNNLPLPDDVKKTERFEVTFDGCGNGSELRMKKYLENMIDDMEKFESIEFMCHPGYLDENVFEGSTLTRNRAGIARFMMSSDFSKELRNNSNIELVTYADI